VKRLVLLLLLCLAAPGARADTLYESGREAWRAGRYAEAHATLLEFRRLPYGRRADVDFMLGTAACRLPARRDWGHGVLDWMLYGYALTVDSRAVVVRERDRCRDRLLADLAVGTLEAIVEERAAGMTGYGKTFYWAEQEKQPLGSYPIRRIRAMARAELLARLVPVGDRTRALALAGELQPRGRPLVHDRFLLLSGAGHGEADLRAIGQTLERYVRFLEAAFDIRPPAHYLTVHLMAEPYSVRQLADRLHGLDVSPATVGYAFVDDASVVAAVPGPAAGTVLHELFHLLVREGFGDIPQWLDEGIAALYEVSGRRGDAYFGLPNWRGRVLEQLWRDRPSVEELIRTEWFLFDDPGQARLLARGQRLPESFYDERAGRRQAANMAMARYFVLYLDGRGELQTVYRALRDRDFAQPVDDARAEAVRLVEAALGRSVATLDREFVAWFRAGVQVPPVRPVPPAASPNALPNARAAATHVATAGLNVRTGPGIAFSRMAGLARGDPVVVVGVRDGWSELALPGGATGFVASRYLVPIDGGR